MCEILPSATPWVRCRPHSIDNNEPFWQGSVVAGEEAGYKRSRGLRGSYQAGSGFQPVLSGFLPTHQTLRLNQRGLQRHKSEH